MTHARHRLAALAALTALSAPSVWASEFVYAVPPGWRDLRHGPPLGRTDMPRELLVQASNSRYAAIAVDPSTTTRSQVGATFNAVETQSTGHVTPALARQVGEGVARELQRAGLNATLIDADVDKIDGVAMGVITIDSRATGGDPYRMRQYIVPGHKSGTMLTYSARRDDFERFVPVFQQSLHGLKGAYDPGVFHWDELFRSGLYGGLAALVIGSVLQLVRRRRDAAQGDEPAADAAPVAAKAPLRRATKHLWFCQECDQPVPSRLDQCRCGGRKPA